jgi:two-component system CheB/CheR fusion protein
VSGRSFHIVGIGASAGGLEALESFFEQMPATEKHAFVVVQHLSPDYKSLMAELLAKHTEMEILQATDGIEVRPGRIYLIPRKKNMTCYQGRLFLTEQKQGLNLPIDIFFRSLAEDRAESAVGIVLSGTGSDGTRGIRAIKEEGGMVMAQSEESAKFDGMPKSAISTGIVDYVLPPERLPEELIRYTSGRVRIVEQGEAPADSQRSALSKILLLIKRKSGVDLSRYKENTIIRRVERRMGINQLDDLRGYLELLEHSPEEVSTLFKEILIGVTKFFRDPEAFENLKEKVFPAIMERKEADEAVRVWVAGCSTGEEAYAMAILLAEYAESAGIHREIKVFATDIDKSALEHASFGIYPESIAADASPELLAKYFVRKGESYQIAQSIREMVVFAYHNVFRDPPFRKIDLISCRNLLIYLQQPLQKQVLNNFQFSLTQGGFLFLGSSESVGDQSRYFVTVDTKWKILRFKGESSRGEAVFGAPDVSWRRSPRERLLSPGGTTEHGELPGQEVRGVYEPLYENLLERYMPPSAIVDEHRQLVHVFGELGSLLKIPAGRTDLNILKMAEAELAIPLGAALEQAMRERREVTLEPITLNGGGGAKDRVVELFVRPLRDRRNRLHYAVVFGTPGGAEPSSGEFPKLQIEESVRRRVENLESELQATKESLQATIEELETSNEELQATNEELLSSNEELQSTNEELQSVNEELITVNAEYQKKIEELSELNADMDNLYASTSIGTIFLDDQMRIRKFTPPVAGQMSIISRDVGRPLTDLAHRLDYDRLTQDIEEVMRSGETKEVETRNDEGGWYLIKIMPYSSESRQIEGSVVSLIDITRRKRAELALKRERDLLMRVLDANPSGITMVNAEGHITYTNKRGEEILGVSREKLASLSYNDLHFHIEDLEGNEIPDDQLPFQQILRTGSSISDYIHRIRRGDKRVTLRIQGSPIYGEEQRIEGAVFNLLELKNERTDEQGNQNPAG